MTKKLLLIVAVIFLIGITPVHALIVSDPGAYARFAQQIQQLSQQTGILQNSYTQQQQILSSLTGNLGRGNGAETAILNLLKLATTNTVAIHNLPSTDVSKMNFSDTKQTQTILDKMYSNDQDIFKQGQNQKYRDLYKQRTIKASLENSEYLISKQQESLTKIQDLARQVNQTTNTKDAQDLTNRILIEILTVQNQQLLLTAQLTRAENAQRYQGVSSSDETDLKPLPSPSDHPHKVGDTFTKADWDSVGGQQATPDECKHFGGCN